MKFFKMKKFKIFKNKAFVKVRFLFLIFLLISLFIYPYFVLIFKPYNKIPRLIKEKQIIKEAQAVYTFHPTNGILVTGSETALSNANVGSWRGLLGNDSNTNGSGNYWQVARVNPGGLNLLIYFDGVELYGANKMIISIEDSNITTGDAYIHQICDWVNSTGVDNTADTYCTGGGWRTLQPRKVAYTNTADTLRVYEIYNGYFSTRATSPGTVINTPLSNFIEPTNKRVLIRVFSTVNSTTNLRIDFAQIEVAIDPFYEVAGFATSSAGATTNFISDLVGAAATNVNASDNVKLSIPMPAANQPIDFYFSFRNVKTYQGMNTILVVPEVCVSNTALTFDVYLWNFTTNSWTKRPGTAITGTACGTDTEYAFAFNPYTITGFNISNYISSTGEIRVRFLTNAPATVYNIQLDRIYIFLGSVNNDSTKCEISWGTGTASDCQYTRDINEALTANPTTLTWQTTAVIEYPQGHHPLDNDDDGTNGEYAFSSNLDFPITLSNNMSVTAIHYAAKYRSNVTTITVKPSIRVYGGLSGNYGEAAGSGWRDTPGGDTNAATTYSYFDTWRLLTGEITVSAEKHIDTVNNVMNMRLRTSASTNTAGGVTRDWDFAMMSIRWIEEPNRLTLQRTFHPTNGILVTGSETALSNANVGSWRGLLGNDSNTNGSGNYWQVARANPGGLNLLIYFDGVELYGANKMIISIEDSNITTAISYIHQICDWVNSTGVDNTADTYCTGGGWRTLQPRKVDYTNTSDTLRVYEIYNGYFSTRATSPGTVINTPLSNFIEPTNKRVLIRVFSTVNSTTNLRIDFAQIEVAIDPFYEVAGFATSSAGATTNFISDLVGAAATNVNASDNVKLSIPMPAANQPIDFYFSFRNVKTYQGMNTILVVPEVCVSNTALTFDVYLWNFTTNSWTKRPGTAITGTACGTDTEYAFAFNPYTITGFNISNYISSTGEIRVRFLTNAPATVYNIQLDRIYIFLGSVNNDSTKCEISWGTGTASDCQYTRDINEALTANPTTLTWQTTAVIEYPQGHHPLDNDDDGTNGEYAFSSNLDFPITLSNNMSVTAIHYAAKYRSNDTTITVKPSIRVYGGLSGNYGEAAGSGWRDTPGGDTNAATTYSYFDTWRLLTGEITVSAEKHIDTVNNVMNMRLRTSASTNTAGGVTRDWDFAMMSIRWIEKPVTGAVTCTLSSTSTSFSALTPSAVSTSSPDITITITSSGGFQINVRDNNGTTTPGLYKSNYPTYLIQSQDATLSAGTDGYGIQATTTNSSISINSKYNKSGNNVGGLSLTDVVLATSSVSVSNATINIKHKASVSVLAPTGDYQDTIIYTCSAQ
jgi:hypothetical protein